MHDSLTLKEFGNVLVNTYFLINYQHYDHTSRAREQKYVLSPIRNDQSPMVLIFMRNYIVLANE